MGTFIPNKLQLLLDVDLSDLGSLSGPIKLVYDDVAEKWKAAADTGGGGTGGSGFSPAPGPFDVAVDDRFIVPPVVSGWADCELRTAPSDATAYLATAISGIQPAKYGRGITNYLLATDEAAFEEWWNGSGYPTPNQAVHKHGVPAVPGGSLDDAVPTPFEVQTTLSLIVPGGATIAVCRAGSLTFGSSAIYDLNFHPLA